MEGGLLNLALALAGFVGGHFTLAYPPVRRRLVAALGQRAFLAGYSILMVLFLAWTVHAYSRAPTVWLWNLGIAGRWVPVVVMPFALMLAVLGLTSRSVTAVGGERHFNAPVRGVGTITRHPFLWGAALWALAHLIANGDAASLLLFGGMAVLALGGMAAIDHKRALALGESWQHLVRTTSILPFAAALHGRNSIDWRGIGWVRPVIAVVLYVALMHGHRWLFGVSALPHG